MWSATFKGGMATSANILDEEVHSTGRVTGRLLVMKRCVRVVRWRHPHWEATTGGHPHWEAGGN
jgi:hypothetical protein